MKKSSDVGHICNAVILSLDKGFNLLIDKATWDSQTSRIRNASAGDRIVSQKALQLRDELYEQLGIPSEFRL